MEYWKAAFTADERQALADRGEAMPDGSYPIRNKKDLSDAIQSYGRADNPGSVKRWIIWRAKALGAADLLPEDWGVSKAGLTGDKRAMKGVDTMADKDQVTALEKMVADLEKQVGELTTQLEAAKGAGEDAAKAAELQKQVADLTKAADDLRAELEVTKGELELAKAMSAEEAAYCKGKSATECKQFMAMKPEERKRLMSKAAADDESLTLHGRTIKKSAVGEDMFEILKAQSAQIADGEAKLAKEREARETAELKKQADAEFAHVPGSVDERAAMLGAINKMDESLQKAFRAVFVQAEKLAKAGFGQIGTGGNKKEDQLRKSANDFDAKVSEIAARDNVSKAKAMVKARHEFPELFKAYQETDAAQ